MDSSLDIHQKLIILQSNIKAPKQQFNEHGRFNYRKCEEIIASFKEVNESHKLGLYLQLTDCVLLIGSRYYVQATATISDGINNIYTQALAREPEDQKGMASPQLTGSCSSYARKYALCGLLGLDDEKDIDSFDNKKDVPVKQPTPTYNQEPRANMNNGMSEQQRKAVYAISQKRGITADMDMTFNEAREWISAQNRKG